MVFATDLFLPHDELVRREFTLNGDSSIMLRKSDFRTSLDVSENGRRSVSHVSSTARNVQRSGPLSWPTEPDQTMGDAHIDRQNEVSSLEMIFLLVAPAMRLSLIPSALSLGVTEAIVLDCSSLQVFFPNSRPTFVPGVEVFRVSNSCQVFRGAFRRE